MVMIEILKILQWNILIICYRKCETGTEPVDEQTLTSLDLFAFLETHKASFGVGETLYSHYDTVNDMLLGSQDYSYTIGQGLCNPIWFDNRLNMNEDKLTISKLDCCHIQGCIDINLAKAARTMRLGLQPPVEYTSVEEAIFDFSPGKVVQNLARTAEEGRGNVILRREHPRVLKCADNMENVMLCAIPWDLCQALKALVLVWAITSLMISLFTLRPCQPFLTFFWDMTSNCERAMSIM